MILAERLKQYLPAMTLALGIIIYLITVPTLILHGGFLHYEAQEFLPKLLSDRSILTRLFDPTRQVEWYWYQARELSYLFDWIDAEFIGGFLHTPWIHFFSVTFVVGILILITLFVKIEKKITWTTTLLLLAFLSSPVPIYSWFFFRTSKILVAVLSFAMVFACHRILSKKQTDLSRANIGWLFGLGFLNTIADKQGSFVALAFCGMFFLQFIAKRERLFRQFSLTFLGVFVAHQVYNFWIGPALVWWIARVPVSFQYQDLGSNTDPSIGLKQLIKEPFFLLFDQIVFLFGNRRWPYAIWTLVALGLGAFYKRRDWKFSAITTFCFFGSTLVLFGVMVLRHSAILWIDVRRIYYWIPILIVFLYLTRIALNRLHTLFPKSRPLTYSLLLLAIIGNITSIKSHSEILHNGHLSDPIKDTALLKTCLIHPIGSEPYNTALQKMGHRMRGVCQALHSKSER